jgi:enamine deaminase RidA (YjgF/YER057c/UK114 family)
MRQNVSTGTPWEKATGYSRAIRVGQQIYVSGTTASDEAGNVIGVGDPYAQAVYIFQKIDRALAAVGASLQDVVRTRMFVTNISQYPDFARAHGEFFSEILPVATMVQVVALIDPLHLIEIEVDAVIDAEQA